MPLEGICLAPDDYALAASPAWVRIDDTYRVQSWSIDRGRPNEMSRTDTGTAQVELVDLTGDFDPTNSGGVFYGLAPLVQAAICLQHPVTAAWSTLFRGFISQIRWVPYQTEEWANVTIDLVDALALFAAYEMPMNFAVDHGGDFVDGNIVFNEDAGLDAVQTRINNVLDGVGWDPSLRDIFTSNVGLQKTVYAPRSTVLQVIQDAVDAEIPDVANLWIGGPRNPGKVVAHGRYARFHPDVAEYQIAHWQLGDDTAAAADPSHVVRISPPLEASLDDTNLYTAALATPQNVADADIEAQYVQDSTAVATKGLRTWSAENLATLGGQGPTTALEETKLFADYVLDNFKTPKVRVGQLTVKSRDPGTANGAQTWRLLCGVDISDIVHLTTSHAGGGGFDTDFYVEGIHYTARPGGLNPYMELTLDVSPRGYYDGNPFEG
jgi:hypothetical protein